MKNGIDSTRKYIVQVSENGKCYTQNFTLNRLLFHEPNDYEVLYAIYDIIDEVLDLKIGEYIVFQPNRDMSTSKGIITRNPNCYLPDMLRGLKNKQQ